MEQTVNANIAQCLVTKNHWGYDSIINICTGSVRNVEWALGDYASVGIFALTGLMLVGVLLMIATMLFSDF